jgi:hypothetical protein
MFPIMKISATWIAAIKYIPNSHFIRQAVVRKAKRPQLEEYLLG